MVSTTTINVPRSSTWL